MSEKVGIDSRLNEGLGGCYERIAFSNIIKRIAQKRGAKSILEVDATYIAGIPGFNSCILARDFEVAVLVKERDYEDTKKAWEISGLQARIIPYSYPLPFASNSFDFVWNHLVFEQSPPIVGEMRRVSRDIVFTTTLSPYSPGFYLHRLIHKLRGKRWDHGDIKEMTIEAMRKIHKYEGLGVVETGALDAPPWLDTVDTEVGGSMTYFDSLPSGVKRKWVWVSADPRCREHYITKLCWSWEQALPRWFKIFFAHHLYVVGTKKEI